MTLPSSPALLAKKHAFSVRHYVMLAFGLGTLPNLLLAGMMAVRLRAITGLPVVRYIGGMAVMLFGIYGGLNALRKIIA
jgi:sulfite exporter TauE/SafE